MKGPGRGGDRPPVAAAAPGGPPPATPPALEVRSLDVPFGRAPGLTGISFQVARGERFSLVGASGAGKTSLLRALSGSGPLTAGSVLVEGEEVTGLPPEGRGMVLLSQRPLLFPHLSVFENVAFPLRVRGTPRSEIPSRVEEALGAVRMEGFGARRPQSLSGGQAHRVALARAVVSRPPVLLLDEPLTSLDPSLREEVRRSILAIREEYGPALVLVTHDLQEAGRMADRVGVVLEGTLAQVASPELLFRRPASAAVARFLGLPNELPGWISRDGSLVLGGWGVGSPGHRPLPPTPTSRSREGPVRALFGSDAGRLLPKGSGGIPGRVEEVRHHPEGAVIRVTLLPGQGDARRTDPVPVAPPRGASVPSRPLSCLVSVDPLRPPLPGEVVEVSFQPDRMHIFDE